MTVRASSFRGELRSGFGLGFSFSCAKNGASALLRDAGAFVADAAQMFLDLPEVRSIREGSLEGSASDDLSTSDKILAVASLAGSALVMSLLIVIF